jgi:hypothetical protein
MQVQTKNIFTFFIRLPKKIWQKTQSDKHLTRPAKFICTIIFLHVRLARTIGGETQTFTPSVNNFFLDFPAIAEQPARKTDDDTRSASGPVRWKST